jgi:hypothetical protein
MSSQPENSEVIASKSVNLLAEFPEISNVAKAAMALSGEGTLLLLAEVLKKHYGGTWVGGTATLTRTELSFKPSALNIGSARDTAVAVPLDKIANVALESGLIMKTVRVETPDFVLRLRCYGAAEFMQKIRDAAQLA